MPLIEVCALAPKDGVDVSETLRAITLAVSEAIPCRRDAVWATWRTIDGGYAVGEAVAYEQQLETHAPIVHVYARRPPDAIERICAAVEEVLTTRLSLPASKVFITVQAVFGPTQ